VNFNFNIEDINFSVDESMLRDEPEQGLQQPSAEPETAVQRQSEHEEFTVEWLLRGEQQQQPIVEPPPGHGGPWWRKPSQTICSGSARRQCTASGAAAGQQQVYHARVCTQDAAAFFKDLISSSFHI
jgi:hypothetical protein